MSDEIHSQLHTFFSGYAPLTFNKGTTLIRAGETPDGIYYLSSGIVRMSTITLDGEELIINLFKPHSFFPMNWAINKTPNTYSFQAVTDVQVMRAPPQDVINFLTSHPDILLDLTGRVFTGLWGLMSQMQHLMRGNAEAKIINILLILATRFGQPQPNQTIKIDIHLTHQDIASLAGTSRETVTRLFTKLKKLQLLNSTHPHITIPNLPQLQQYTTS